MSRSSTQPALSGADGFEGYIAQNAKQGDSWKRDSALRGAQALEIGIRNRKNFKVPAICVALKRFIFEVKEKVPTESRMIWPQQNPVGRTIVQEIATNFVKVAPIGRQATETTVPFVPAFVVRVAKPIPPAVQEK